MEDITKYLKDPIEKAAVRKFLGNCKREVIPSSIKVFSSNKEAVVIYYSFYDKNRDIRGRRATIKTKES